MDYYMLKMTWTDDNGEASLDHYELRKFISQTHLIGLGSPRKGAYVFEHQIRKGDIVIVLGKRWAPQVIVKVLDDNAEEYHPDTSLYPLLAWIEHVRKVEILAWCYAPDPQLNLPSFNTNWSRNTCCHIDDIRQQETIKKWIETVMGNKTSQRLRGNASQRKKPHPYRGTGNRKNTSCQRDCKRDHKG